MLEGSRARGKWVRLPLPHSPLQKTRFTCENTPGLKMKEWIRDLMQIETREAGAILISDQIHNKSKM